MNSFGLGIILNFVDNASTGMNSATNTFMNMSSRIQGASNATSDALAKISQGTMLNILGDSLVNFGNGMTGVAKNILNNVQQVGSDFELFKVTLSQVYGGAAEAENQIAKLMDFAVKTPFEVADTKDLLVTLKSQGIEAFDSIKGSISGAEQQTLQWLSDLMAFKPEVPMSRWKLAFQNYLGSGLPKVLENVLDMGKIPNIIGHAIGSTPEERINDLVDLIEKKNLTGLTNNMFGTMQQNMSNISDYFTMFYKAIGDAGVFNNLAKVTHIASETLASFDLESGKLPQIAQIFADAFNKMLDPVVTLTENVAKLITKMIDFAIANPGLSKLALILFSIVAASTVALGWILKIAGGVLQLAGSIQLLGGISKVFGAIKTGFAVLGGKMISLIPLGILLYQAWKNNFLGIQDAVSNFSKKLELIWTYFKQGYFTDEQYDLAQQLGITDAIEKISVLSYYWQHFKQGFGEGWDKAFTKFFDALTKGLEKLDNALKNLGVDSGLSKVIDTLNSSFKDLFAPGKEQDFEKLGETFGNIAADALILISALKLLNIVLKGFKGVATIINGIGKAFTFVGKALGLVKLGSFIGDLGAAIKLVLEGNNVFAVIGTWFPTLASIVSKIGGIFSSIGGAIASFVSSVGIGTIASALGGIVAAIGGTIAYVQNLIDMFKNGESASNILKAALGGLTAAIGAFLIALAVGATVATGGIAALVVGIVAVLGILVAVIKNHWSQITNFFTSTLPQWFSSIGSSIAGFFSNIWSSIVNSSFVQTVISVFTSVVGTIKNVIMTIVGVVVAIGGVIGGVIGTIVSAISAVAQIIWSVLVGVFNVIKTVVVGVATTIGNVFSLIGAVIRTAFYAVLWVVMSVVTGIVNVFKSIWNVVQQVFSAIGSFVASVFQAIWNVVSPIFSAIGNFISSVFHAILSVAQTVISAICLFFQMIWNVVSSVFSAIGSFISSVFQTILSIAQSVLSSIQSFFSNCAAIIQSVWQGVSGFFSGVFSAIQGFATSAASSITGAFQSAAGAVKSVFDWINNAIGKAKDFVNGIGSKIKSAIPGFAIGVENFAGGLAVINEQGGELVDLPQGTRVIPHDESIKESLTEGIRLGAKAMSAFNSMNSNGTPVSNTSYTAQGSTDNRVIFSKGSIVITTVGATQSEMEKAAEFIMKYIERKQKLRSLAVRA